MSRPTLVADAQTPTELVPGTRLGRWVLERVIGHGATAVVWAARHERLGSPVAIKVFARKNLGFHDVLGEARAAAGIPSPFAIWVYDVDTFQGHHAIVMELCGTSDAIGESLAPQADMDPRTAARIVAQAGRGVAAAHAGGVFHKDIKPANILIHPTDGRAQITDFGLANPSMWKAASPQQPAAETTVAFEDLTEAPARAADSHREIRGAVRVGTPEYMAPEQAEGLRADLDGRDPRFRPYLVAIDVYGLGATLYALLAGRPPFPHGELAGRDPTALEVMTQVVDGPPPALRSVNPRVPRRLARVVERAMSRDPLQRYAEVRDLVRDLEDWGRDHPTSLERSPLVRLGVHLWRERVRVGLGVGFAAFALATTGLTWMNERQINTQQASITEQRHQLDRLADAQRTLQHELALADRQLGEAQVRIKSQAGQLDAASRELARRDDALSHLTSELDLTSASLNSTESELDEAASRALDLERERESLRTDLDGQRGQLETTLGDLAAVQADLSTVRSLLIDEAGRSAELEQRVASLTGEVERQRAATAQAEERARALTEESQQLRQTVRDTMAALDAKSAELMALKAAPAP